MYAAIVSKGKQLEFEVKDDRQAYLVLFEGEAAVNGTVMKMRDALEIVKENITVTAGTESHLLIIEMAFDEECYNEKYAEDKEQYKGE
jgi:redox-sensitive bicupin YhaK (pirin superfamily)